MKPAPFEFHAPDSEEEILALLAEHADDARPLAGGQSLVPLMNMRILQPAVLISVNRCRALAHLQEDGEQIRCGAGVTQAGAQEASSVRDHVPLLCRALPYVGVQASRNFGTICGSLAHADPLAELPSVAAALEARFVIASVRGTRAVPAARFFVSALTTCMEPDELLREVCFPKATPRSRSAFFEIANRAHAFAIAGLAAAAEMDEEGRCMQPRLAAMGMGATTLRLTAAEALLEGEVLDDALIAEAGAAASREVTPAEDLHASRAYRRHLAGVLVERALRELRAGEGEESKRWAP